VLHVDTFRVRNTARFSGNLFPQWSEERFNQEISAAVSDITAIEQTVASVCTRRPPPLKAADL